MGLTRSDILLLTTGGDFELAAADGLYIAHDGTDPTVEQAKCQILVAQQTSLFASLLGDAQDARAAEALDSVSYAELKILPSGIKREPDRDLLALLQRLTSGLAGGDDQKADLTEAELLVVELRLDRKDLLDGRQDCV
jgi:uncharacterized protein YihD (DUF1040 family)